MATTSGVREPGWWTSAALAILALLATGLRLYGWQEPVERDLAIHAVIGHEFLQGRELYSDLWDHKPPGTFLMHAAFNALFGYGPHYLLVMNILLNVGAMLGIHALAWALTGRQVCGLVAALLWVLVSDDIHLQANQPNSEAMAAPLLLFGAYCWYQVSERRLPSQWAILAGGLFFAASLLKQHYVLMPAGMAAAFLIHAACLDRAALRAELRTALTIAGVGLVGWLATLLVFRMQGTLDDLIDALVTYNRGYGGDILRTLKGAHWYWQRFFPSQFAAGLLPYVVTGALAVAAMLWLRRWKLLLLFLFWVLSTELMVALPGKFFPHYFQLWMPVMVIGVALLLDCLLAWPPGGRRLAMAVVIACLCLTTYRLAVQFAQPAWNWAGIKYPTESFGEARLLGEDLATILPPDSPVFFFGHDQQVLFYGRLRPVNGKLYARWFADNPLMSTRLLADTTERFMGGGFDVVIVNAPLMTLNATHINDALNRDFVAVPDCFAHNEVWVRRGSALQPALADGLPGRSAASLQARGLPLDCGRQAPALVMAGTPQ
ncbi:ArnT family glycosyltransferase [Uliginosibacterium sp. H1]|uniref:ArnT family glycosyltransferase n=1 Tax=Uliginosibacterium sp. H1 TaxID=3114757 RepID=UPI002E19E2BE|nr:hypothetical protein [Uliginosibacterium sp. H1]